MIPRLVTLLLASVVPPFLGEVGPVSVETWDVARDRPDSVVADTILRPDLSVFPTVVSAGLSAAPDEPHVTLGLRRIRVTQEGLTTAVRPSPAPREWRSVSRQLRVDPLQEVMARRVAGRFLSAGPVPAPRPATAVDGDRFVTDFADLALSVRSRMELGGDWARFEPCDARFGTGCNPSLIPQLRPEVLFGVQVNGTILDRVHVDVDFDQSRDEANRINFFYEGGEDDVLQRLEVGDVTFNLPRSRFLTEGVPAGNFGFQAEGQIGPVDFQGVWAQQRGDLNTRVFQLSGLGDQRSFVQQDTIVIDDADYVRGQFFFLVDPTEISGYPHIDIQELDPGSAPASVGPGDEPIQLYRFEDDPTFRQQVEGFIQADAVADLAGETVRESGWFRYLQQGVDFFVHPSGLWITLRQPLSPDEMLATAFITAVGDTIGDYNPELIYNQGGRPELRLLKASSANHQPGRPTWDLEMHQVYRVSGSADVEPGSVELTVSLGELSAGRTFKRRPSGEDITFLRLLGLDEEAPIDLIDPSALFSTDQDPFAGDPVVPGTFMIFPTLRPFAEPGPVPSLRLDEAVTGSILGDDANLRIYEEEDPFERVNAGRFRLSISYRIRSEGLISSFSLGAFGIRDGSERIRLGDRQLLRGVDYEIDYDLGQISLLEPEILFASSPEASIHAAWEQRSLFQVTPTQVFGLRGHTALGSKASFDILGLYQSERSVVNRPVLGTEPGAAFMGGVSGSFASDVRWMDRVWDAVPGLRLDGPSTFRAEGEVALSLPNPNTVGTSFVDDFDGAAQTPITLQSGNWLFASAPVNRDGAELDLPGMLDAASAGSLVWQHTWILQGPGGDSLGVHEGLFPRADIDNEIRVAGSEVREPSLLVSLGEPANGEVGWRSLMTPLATNGLDLTKTEFLEFYASGGNALSVIVDLGTVSEDAFVLDDLGGVAGTRTDGRPWGLGVLDQEADPSRGEIWSIARDGVGAWNESCLAEPGQIYPIADPRAVCTRGNGRPDSEDLDSDGNLDDIERHLRFVVNLGPNSPFRVRTSAETGTDFQLYRIPIRGAGGVEVGGTITEADLRAVRHLRLTLAGPSGRVHIARMRLVGSRWIKRAGEGVLTGIIGDTTAISGRVEVTTVSGVTEPDYVSPPGVLEELADPSRAFSGEGIEFNERSLGLRYEDVPHEGRAEVYFRFPQRPRDFLSYREIRLWALPRAGDFGGAVNNRFFVKVGTDSENFYLYRTHLPTPVAGAVTPADWQPEVVIDFEEWLELRRRAEEQISLSPPAPGDPATMLWSADSTYAVVLADRGRAPNLAAVREMSIGVWNESGLPSSGELWIDELRLGKAVRDAGIATSFSAVFDGSGVLQARVGYTERGAFFRQLRDRATFQDDRTLDISSTLALDRWLPSAWGFEMPVSFELTKATQAPVLLAASDVRAGEISGLRDTRADQMRVGFSMSKRTPTPNPILGFVLDGLDVRASYSQAEGSTVTTENESSTVDASVGWVRDPEAVDVALIPAFAQGLVRTLLPGFLGDKVAGSRLRLNPVRVSVETAYFQQDSRVLRFEEIVRRPDDGSALATLVPREALQLAGDLRLRPLAPLTADIAFLAVRDLLSPEKASADEAVRSLVGAARSEFVGLDLGWETNRTLRTQLAYRPSVFDWLRTDFDWTTVYQSDRNTNFVEFRELTNDSVATLTRNARGQRDWSATVGVTPARVALSWFGEAEPSESRDVAQLRALVSAVQPITITLRDGVTSRFNRDPVDPRFDYQLGWAGDDGYRFVDADTAASLTDRRSWQGTTGVTLPGGAGIQVGFRWSDATTLDTRSDRRTQEWTWPSVQASLPVISMPSFSGMQSIRISSGVIQSERETEFGGRALQRRFESDRQVPLEISIQWFRTLATSYRGAFRVGKGVDPTGDTERDEAMHRFSLTSQLLPPASLARRLDRPIRLSLSGTFSSEVSCRITVSGDGCVAFIDLLSRTANLSLDTSIGGFELGMIVSYDDRQSFVGQQTGSTQFQVGLFGQLEFAAGMLPGG